MTRLPPQSPFGPSVFVAEGLARHRQPVEPGLQVGADGEIVHRRADDDDIGGQELVERGEVVGKGRRPLVRGGSARRADQRPCKVRQRHGRKIARDDLQTRMRRRELGDDLGGQAPADGRVAEDAGVDMQELHGEFLLCRPLAIRSKGRYAFVTEAE